MTDRSKRNITPGKGDIYTFMDCPDRTERSWIKTGFCCDTWICERRLQERERVLNEALEHFNYGDAAKYTEKHIRRVLESLRGEVPDK